MVGLGGGAGAPQFVERPLHGSDAPAPLAVDRHRFLVRHADGAPVQPARRSDWRISPAWRSSNFADRGERCGERLRRLADVDDDRVGPHEHELAAAVDGERDASANENLGEAAQPLRVIDDHDSRCSRVALPRSRARRARRRAASPVRHRSTLDVNVIGSISIDDLRALVDVEPQQALDGRARRLADREPAVVDAADLWWIAGLAERQLGDTARGAILAGGGDPAGPGQRGSRAASRG